MRCIKIFCLQILALILAILGCFLPASGQEIGEPLTIQDAVKLALERNPEVLIAKEQLLELKGRIKEVKAGAFPQINGEASGLRMRDPSILNSGSFDKVPSEFKDALVPVAANMFDLAVTVKQPLYTAGKVNTAIRLAEKTRQEKVDSLEAVERQITYRVFQAFQDILVAEENLSLTRETQQQWQKHLDQAQNRFKQGVVTEIDVLRSQVNAANIEPELIRAENRLSQARSALNNLIVRDLEAPTQIVGKLEYHEIPAPDLEALEHQSMEALPELKAAQMLCEEAKLSRALANAENKLSVDMNGRWGYSARDPKNLFNNDFTRWSVTFNFNMPFYDGGRKAGLIEQALSRERSAEQNLARLKNNVRLEIKSARDEMISAAKAIASAQLNVTQAEKVQTMMQANYQFGAATTLDIVDSQAALTQARNARISAVYSYEIAKARMRLAAGIPILDEEAGQ
jgi:outer membrane protein